MNFLKILLMSCVIAVLSGCGIQNAKQGRLNQSYFDASQTTLTAAQRAEASALPMSQEMSAELSESSYIQKYLSVEGYKAMYGAFPLSCNNRYYYYRNSTQQGAMARALTGCQTKMDRYNDLTGTNCQCRIIAMGNTLFYDPSVYLGSVPYLPMVGQINSGDGSTLEIKGLVESKTIGASASSFQLKGPDGQIMCNGQFDIRQKAKGDLTMSCFGGEIRGRGEFVHKEFDTELRVWNGTAIIQLSDGAEMLVVYGRDAL